MKYKKIALIFPCYNEEGVISKTVYEVHKKLNEHEFPVKFEYVFVDDGSKDKTCEEILSLQDNLSNTYLIQLSRNFGKEAAIFAGLEYARDFDGAVFMDADGQDPPEVLIQMIQEFLSGKYDDVYAKRISRADSSPIKRKFIEKYYHILNQNAQFQIEENVGDFRIISKNVIQSLLELKERSRYTKGLFAYVGFRKKEILMDRPERLAGESKWNLSKQISFALDGFVNFTDLPYKTSVWVAIILAFFFAIYNIFLLCFSKTFTVISIGLDFILGGLLLISVLGVITIKILTTVMNEVKQRPIYIQKK